jgi:hypothetical protein
MICTGIYSGRDFVNALSGFFLSGSVYGVGKFEMLPCSTSDFLVYLGFFFSTYSALDQLAVSL